MRSSALALSLALASPAFAQSPAFLVKDVNVQAPPPANAFEPPFAELTVAGGVAFFSAAAPELGLQFWVTDGTEGGTFPFTPNDDLNSPAGPGTTFFGDQEVWRTDGTLEGTGPILGGNPPFDVLNTVGPVGAQASGGFVFSADDGAGGRGLWRTDGTVAGTELIRAFTTPSLVATPNFFRAIGGTAFFVANDGVTGRELWRTDGTEAGTALVVDLAPGSASALPQELTVIGSELWFTAETAVGRELYKTDGTEPGTVLVKDTRNPGSGEPSEITLAGTTIFFAVYGATGPELWKSDGTEPGTTLVATFPTGGIGSNLTEIEALGSEVVFDASSSESGHELWKSDGTTTQILRDIRPGPLGGLRGALLTVGGYLYFRGFDGTADVLWRTDGTQAGTIPLAAVDAIPLASLDGETLLFRGTTATQGRELWRSDGTPAGTTIVKNIAKEAATASGLDYPVNVRDRVDLAGTLLFDANEGLLPLEKVWRSDGTSAGTVVVTDAVDPGTGYWVMGPHAYFPGRPDPEPNPTAGQGLWRTDGTAAGTELVRDVSPNTSPDGTARILDLAGVLLFSGNTTANGLELWRSDGTAAGTTLVEDLSPGTNTSVFPPRAYSSAPLELTKVGGIALFTAVPDPTAPAPRKLFRTDGTAGATFLVDPPGGLSNPTKLVEIGGLLYFIAKDSLGASRMWRSDGTAAGTVVVPIPLEAGDIPSAPVALGSALAYIARTPSGGLGVWRTDGTSAGTSLLIAFSPGVQVANLSPLGSRVVFTSLSPDLEGSRFFVTDGTPAGTGLLKTTGVVPRYYSGILTIGNRLVVTACDPAAGCEPWVTDGTDAGTRRLADIGPGGDSSFPLRFVRSGDFVYFSAYDSRGRELWAIPTSALALKACEDGWDNDGDGSIDGADPGCPVPTAPTESPPCNDGVDNDGDLAIDLADPNCGGQAWRKESPGCGLLGIEGVVFAAAVLARRAALTRRRARAV